MSKENFRLQFGLLAQAVLVVASMLLLEQAERMDAPFVAFFLVAGAWQS
jgi:hypothetical protein